MFAAARPPRLSSLNVWPRAAGRRRRYLVSVVGPASEKEARKYETKKHTKVEAEFKQTTTEQAQAISMGYRCVRKKSPQDECTADPLAPDHSMLMPGG